MYSTSNKEQLGPMIHGKSNRLRSGEGHNKSSEKKTRPERNKKLEENKQSKAVAGTNQD